MALGGSGANGWTGGQYSAFRAVLGVWLGLHALGFLAAGEAGPVLRVLAAIGVPAAAALALGFRDRLAALALFGVWTVLVLLGAGSAADPTRWIPGGLLIVHASLPPAPYGSLDARGRPDPAGGWHLPSAALRAVRVGLLAALLSGAARLSHDVGLALPSAYALLAALASDPAWIRPRAFAGEAPRVYYDGACGLCHTTVRFLLSEDATGAIRYAPFESEAFAGESHLPDDLPDSVIVRAEGRLLVRAEGILLVGAACGGLWRALAALVGLVPQPMLDACYDRIAAIRHRLFRKPEGVCPIVPFELRRRFLP